jgi:hypothetical protein
LTIKKWKELNKRKRIVKPTKKEEWKLKKKKILVGMIFCLLVCLFLPLKAKSEIPVSLESQTSEPLPIIQKESNDSQNNFSCGTLKILENFRENWLKSEVKMESTPSFYSSRPTDPGGPYWVIGDKQHLLPQLYNNTTRFIIHWTNGSDGDDVNPVDPLDAVPLNDTNTNGIPDYIENFAGFFEDSWDFEVTLREFPAPPSDAIVPNDNRSRNPDERYDIFIYHTPPGYLAYAYFEQYPISPSFSYIGIRNNLEPLKTMQAIAAHEFFHAIQFVYDCTEESWWMEASATWMEDEVFPDSNDNYRYLLSWFLFSDTYGLEYTDAWHEYGTFIFAKHLSEDFGYNITKEVWEEMNQTNGTNGLAAIENVLLSKNSTLLNEFSEFITANFFLEDCYEDGAEYRDYLTGKLRFNGVWIEHEYDASTASNPTEIYGLKSNGDPVNWDAWMDCWAADYITLKLDPAKLKYRITFNGLNLAANYLVKLVTKNGTIFDEKLFELDAQKDGYVDLDYDVFENVTLIMANAGNTATANPSWRVTIEILETIPIYDVAVIDVRPSTYSAVTEQTINIAVTVKNNGNTRDESFNVSTYWGGFLIERRTVASLAPGAQRTLTIFWIIPSDLLGSERVWANATIVTGETNIVNNNFKDGILTITIGIHNVVVVGVESSKTVIGEDYGSNVKVYIADKGNYTETFEVTLYANTTIIQTEIVTVGSGVYRTVTFTWDTTGFAKGNYIISAYAWPVPDETDTTDNTFFDGWIIITIPGDINGDAKVKLADLVILAKAYNSRPGNSNWNPNADLDNNGVVNLSDLVMLAKHYGEENL